MKLFEFMLYVIGVLLVILFSPVLMVGAIAYQIMKDVEEKKEG